MRRLNSTRERPGSIAAIANLCYRDAMDEEERKKILGRMKEAGGFFTRTFGADAAQPDGEEEPADLSEKDFHIERMQRQMLELKLQALQQRFADQQAHLARLEETVDRYQSIIEQLQSDRRAQQQPGSSGFGSWRTSSTATPNYERAKSSVNAMKEANEYVANVYRELNEDSRKFREYSHWLWQTKAHHVSFEDWKAGRYVLVTGVKT